MEKLDVIIFGASGFTGKYTVLEAVQLLKGLKWGVAGRSKEKLEKILEEISEKAGEDLKKIPIILADVSDEQSLRSMASATKVLINCVGPYRYYGEPVVRACLDQGTHYVDFTAEPQFMERMQLLYNEEAQEKGVYIVSACGFDSVPADMGVTFLQQKFNGCLNSVELYFRVFFSTKVPLFSTVANYATWESIMYFFACSNELRDIRSKLFKQKLPKLEPKQGNRFLLHKSNDVGGYISAPYPGVDHSIVMRSQRHFYEKENKRPIQLKIYFALSNFLQFFTIVIVGGVYLCLLNFKCGRNLLKRHPKLFSLGLVSKEGPTEKIMNNTKFELTFVGKGWKECSDDPLASNGKRVNKKMVTKLTSPHSAYGATCISILLSTKTILEESDRMPGNGGVFTPGAAFSNTSFLQKLMENGFDFQVVDES